MNLYTNSPYMHFSQFHSVVFGYIAKYLCMCYKIH